MSRFGRAGASNAPPTRGETSGATDEAAGGWLTIHEASALVGVSQATLRRWAEAGDVPAFVTPGGHRRFSRSSILALLPGPRRAERSLRDLGETPERVTRHYRHELARPRIQARLPEVGEGDKESFREPGRRILAAVLAYLDADGPGAAESELRAAEAASADYGRLARERGLDAPAAAGVFMCLRTPFLDELATISRRRRLETGQAASLLLTAVSVFDRLLVALLDGHAAGGPAGHPTPECSSR